MLAFATRQSLTAVFAACLAMVFASQVNARQESISPQGQTPLERMFAKVVELSPMSIGKLSAKSAYQDELGLSAEQITEIRRIHKNVYVRMMQLQQLNNSNHILDQSNSEKLLSKEDEFFAEAVPDFLAVLHPAQIKRFQQLAIWRALDSRRTFSIYRSESSLDQIANISKSERVRLNEKLDALENKFNDEVEKLWQEHHRKIRASVTTENHDEINSLLGEPAPLTLRIWSRH